MFKRFLVFLFIFLLLTAINLLPSHAEELTPLKKGEKLYDSNCAVCHGDKGDGKTWVSEDLNPKPQNFTDPKVIKTLTRKRMIQSITNGREGTAMQPFKTQLLKDEIELIVDYIRAAFMKIDAKPEKKK
ncbi:MAG: cytochrome c [Nitrospirae bacterium]|nr:cytochrome c [Nitrospirota bacterium]